MPYKRLRYKCYDLQCHKARRTMTSIVPYKSFVGLRQSIYVSPRRDGAAGTLQIRSIPCSTSNIIERAQVHGFLRIAELGVGR